MKRWGNDTTKYKVNWDLQKKSGTSTKESEEIAGEQSAIVFKRWLDPYIVNRTSKKYFEEEDYQDVQIDMKNKGDFPGQEDLQKNEKG